MTDMKNGVIYTFYSYKGGVGRTMALANVAELLYKQGKKVLAVDWDLEAPGLEEYFPIERINLYENTGVIDLLQNYKKLLGTRKLNSWDELEASLLKDFNDAVFNIYPESSLKGSLSIIPAGLRQRDQFKEYADAVKDFDWTDFYDKWDGELYIKWLQQQMKKEADVILIDSRTGVTEVGGVCVYQLADTVVMFCTASKQSIEGTHRVAEDLRRPAVQKWRGGKAVEIIVVPARVESLTEGTALNSFRKRFESKFKDFMPEAVKIDIGKLWDFIIPHVPYYAFEERVAVRESEQFNAQPLVKAFKVLTSLMLREQVETDAKKGTETTKSPYHKNLEQSVFLITSSDSDNKNFATGFAIKQEGSFSYILSCAHVIEELGGEDKIRVADIPAHLVAQGSPKDIDLAVLRVEGLGNPHPFILRDLGSKDQRLMIRGFSAFDIRNKQFISYPLSGHLGDRISIESPTKTEPIMGWDLSIEHAGTFSTLKSVYSGSPVCYEDTDIVLGVFIRNTEMGRRAYAISISNLEKIWPGILHEPTVENHRQAFFRITSSQPDNMNFGTGFIIKQDGNVSYILTCAVVVELVGGENNVRVEGCPVQVVACGSPDRINLAVLKVEGMENFTPFSMQDLGKEGLPFRIKGFGLFDRKTHLFAARTLSGTLGKQADLHLIHTDRVSIWGLFIEHETGLFPEIEPSYVGSPVCDKESGVVLAVFSHRGKYHHHAISISGLRQVWPDMPPDLIADQSDKAKESQVRDYRYDVFLSYGNNDYIDSWVKEHFIPLLQWLLEDSLGRPSEVFIAKQQKNILPDWKTALAHSRCLIPVWSPSNFKSKWSSYELSVMIRREAQFPENPHRLIMPAVLSGAKTISATHTIPQFECSDYVYPGAAFRSSSKYIEFVDKMRIWCRKVADTINSAPDWRKQWFEED